MRKFIYWLEDWMPFLWAVLWVAIITLMSFGAVLWLTTWILRLMGVL